jgi:raffinose/stachyose/melibiose transport system permease protein
MLPVNKERRATLIVYVAVSVFLIVDVAPLVWLLLSSVRETEAIAQQPWAIPTELHLQNFVSAWDTANLSVYFQNSVLIGLSATVLAIFFGAAAAYAVSYFARYRRLSRYLYTYFLMGLVVPVNALLIPVYLLVNRVGVTDARITLPVVYAAFTMSVTFYILESFIRKIPRELSESAVIDGCGVFNIFLRIVIPTATPALATVFILNFLTNWNEFILALLLTGSVSERTVPVGLANFASQYQIQYGTMAAGVLMAIIPVIIVFVVFQQYVVKGLTAGAVKG